MKNNNELNIENNNNNINEMESEEESALKQSNSPGMNEGVDEVDFVPVANSLANGHANGKVIPDEKSCVMCKSEQNVRTKDEKDQHDHHKKQSIFKFKPKRLSDCEVKVCVKNNLHTLDKLQLFKFYQRKRSDPTCDRITNQQKKPKFTKSITIAKLFGNNYNPKNAIIDAKNKNILTSKPPLHKNEKFYKADTESGSNLRNEDTQSLSESTVSINDTYRHHHTKPFKTLSRSFGKLLRRNYSSVDISIPDPEYKVSYLGNVLTGWARGKSIFCLKFVNKNGQNTCVVN